MKRPPVIRVAFLFAALLGSLTMVVWRQSQALEMLERLDSVRAERTLEEARRSSLARRVEQLESRARVSSAARDRLGMRLPTGGEIVILPFSAGVPAVLAGSAPVEGSRGSGRDRRHGGDE